MSRAMQPSASDDSILANVLARTLQPRAARSAKPVPAQSRAPTWALPGVHGKARITTLFGELPIEALRLRDEVKLDSGRYQRIQWIDCIRLDEGFLGYHPDAQPVLLRAGALGPGKPRVDMMVSPHQTLDASMIHRPAALTTARSFSGRPNVLRRSLTNVTYYLFHCGEEACVSVEGLWLHTTP